MQCLHILRAAHPFRWAQERAKMEKPWLRLGRANRNHGLLDQRVYLTNMSGTGGASMLGLMRNPGWGGWL
jgi:hypothetical protein